MVQFRRPTAQGTETPLSHPFWSPQYTSTVRLFSARTLWEGEKHRRFASPIADHRGVESSPSLLRKSRLGWGVRGKQGKREFAKNVGDAGVSAPGHPNWTVCSLKGWFWLQNVPPFIPASHNKPFLYTRSKWTGGRRRHMYSTKRKFCFNITKPFILTCSLIGSLEPRQISLFPHWPRRRRRRRRLVPEISGFRLLLSSLIYWLSFISKMKCFIIY